jgi:hypothetical protein
MQMKTFNDDRNTFDKNLITIYDIEYNRATEVEPNFRIFKELNGLSQLNFQNSLYLCGAGEENSDSGSYFMRFDPLSSNHNVNILVTATHHHYFPVMYGWKNEFILVIGGRNTKYCEIYGVKTNKWKNLPELPEERFRCNIIYEEVSDFMYLFGGMNSDTGKNCSSILRLNMKTILVWETMIVKHNSHLLAKNSSACLKFEKSNSIFILGGYNNENEITETIIEFDLTSKIASEYRKKLEVKSSFTQQNGNDLNKTEFFLFDESFFIHKISKLDFKIELIDYRDLLNGEE